MEHLLRGLFDFQKYESNVPLQSLIDSVHRRYSTRELSLENLEQVFAAGTPVFRNPDKNSEN